MRTSNIREALFGQGAEEGMARQPGLRGGGAGEAAEEARSLAGRPERGRMLRRQLIQESQVELELPSRRRFREPAGGSRQAVRTVAASVSEGLAEVADERLHLAALVLDERDHSFDPLRL